MRDAKYLAVFIKETSISFGGRAVPKRNQELMKVTPYLAWVQVQVSPPTPGQPRMHAASRSRAGVCVGHHHLDGLIPACLIDPHESSCSMKPFSKQASHTPEAFQAQITAYLSMRKLFSE